MMSIDQCKPVIFVLLDRCAAFNTVDHNVLYSRVKDMFDLSGKVLEWIRSYLEQRSQRACLLMVRGVSPGCRLFGTDSVLCGGVLLRRVSLSENGFVKFRSRRYRCRTFAKDLGYVVWLLPDVWVFFK